MDVTSLLNQSAVSAYRKEHSRESTPPSAVLARGTLPSASLPTPSPDRTSPQRDWEIHHSKGRTPWSAGGYALPFQSELKFRSNSIFSSRSTSENLDSDTSNEPHSAVDRYSRNGSTDSFMGEMDSSQALSSSSRNLQTSSIREDDEGKDSIGTPDSLGHKFSDSHSSLSSYASWRSRPHSRLSSATTVSGSHSVCPSVAEVPFPELGASPNDEHNSSAAVPTHQLRQQSLQLQGEDAIETRRPSSPSDAVLNMKGTMKLQPDEEHHANESSIHESRVSVALKSHKRAISAPSFSHGVGHPARNHIRLPSAVLPPPHEVMAIPRGGTQRPATRDKGTAEEETHVNRGEEVLARSDAVITSNLGHARTQSSSAITDIAFGYNGRTDDAAASIPTNESDDQCRCMFVENCDTGSQLRKAISHLFGRNKTCTLKIPKEVWVYYCRKHYQRIRYRNARSYPVNQMELVQLQIERLQKWSDKNIQSGKGAYIKSWALSLRKREEKRLLGSKGAMGDDDGAAHNTQGGGSGIPRWIIEKIGEGYATEHMFEIAARLRDEIINGNLTQVPEIEFLPDIVDDNEDASAKPTRHRRQNAGSVSSTKMPKRKAAEFPILARHSPTYGDDPYMTYRQDHSDDTDDVISPSGKRPRTARGLGFSAYHTAADMSSPYRPGSSQGPYGATTYSHANEANSLPPRAPNVVPRMQPMSYGAAYPHTGRTTRYDYDRPGHNRHASYNGSYETEYAGGPYYQPAAGQHHGDQRSSFQFSGHESPRSHQVLPPIHDQVHSEGHSHGPYEIDRPSFDLRTRALGGHSRPMHQRSASAYTPVSQRLPSFARPSSSGTDEASSRLRYETDYHSAPYDVHHQGAQGRGQDESHQYQYGDRPEWGQGQEYGQGSLFRAPSATPHPYAHDQEHGHHHMQERTSPVYGTSGSTSYAPAMPIERQHSS